MDQDTLLRVKNCVTVASLLQRLMDEPGKTGVVIAEDEQYARGAYERINRQLGLYDCAAIDRADFTVRSGLVTFHHHGTKGPIPARVSIHTLTVGLQLPRADFYCLHGLTHLDKAAQVKLVLCLLPPSEATPSPEDTATETGMTTLPPLMEV
jgi:hypothetical protein